MMPITPLHLGLLAPLNHWLPGKVNNLAFWIVTLWLDASAIAYYALGLEMGEFHGPETHSFIAAGAIAGVVAVLGFAWYVAHDLYHHARNNEQKAYAWCSGAFLGGMSHILLDAMVHSEILPLHPLPGNPFYWGGMSWISLILVPPLVWLISMYVSDGVHLAQRTLAVRRARKSKPAA